MNRIESAHYFKNQTSLGEFLKYTLKFGKTVLKSGQIWLFCTNIKGFL